MDGGREQAQGRQRADTMDEHGYEWERNLRVAPAGVRLDRPVRNHAGERRFLTGNAARTSGTDAQINGGLSSLRNGPSGGFSPSCASRVRLLQETCKLMADSPDATSGMPWQKHPWWW